MRAFATVRTVGDIVTQLRAFKRHPDQELWYRGHGSDAFQVLPSIWRKHTREEERDLTNRFRARAAIRYPNSPRYDQNAGWLSLMQHYGLPTRLLDWTRSPLIAAYFAVEQCMDGRVAPGNAEIWILDPFGLNVSQGFNPITPPIDANKCLKMLVPAFADGYEENERVRAVMATETDMRMFVQQGCFTIHSSMRPLEEALDGSR